ncbi:SRPBCC family protein [Halorussus halobius]|uniref:SRPBCC family protein n=1 Tax=Halorussus halobius TaxID=1710537 RepID=UPI001091E505|nr:SRPBCC family protein [Halorussus halobius]
MTAASDDLPADIDVRSPAAGGDTNRLARLATTALGGALLTLGARRRSLPGVALALAGGWLLYRGVAGGGDAGRESHAATATDAGTAVGESGRSRPDSPAPPVERTVTVGRPADELHEFWRDPEELSRVLGDSVSVTSGGEDRHHWRVTGPFDRSVEWDAEIVEDRPGERLRWESVEGAALPATGSVRFRPAPGDRGTEVTLTLEFDPPGGRVGDAALSALGVVPEALAGTALDRFKSLAETGEIPTIGRNSSGRGAGDVA